MHILERLKATEFTYGLDKETDGVIDNTETVAEILADKGKGIDCEDFAVMTDFWMKAAIEEGYLPEGSESYMLVGSSLDFRGHAVAVYQSPEGESYIIDGTANSGRLFTFSQYKEHSDYLDRTWGVFEYSDAPGNLANRTFVRRTPIDKLNFESDSPIDKSISNIDLKKKIYSQHGVAPDPSSPSQDIHDYYDSLLQYTNIEFVENKLEYTLANQMALLPNAGSAIAEGTVATAFALYKRHKINRRRNNITAAYNVKTKQEKNPAYYRDKPMNLQIFRDFSHLSFLIDDNSTNKQLTPLVNVVNCHKNYQTADNLSQTVNSLIEIFPEDENLLQLKDKINEEYIANPKYLAILQKQLKKYGITIEYQKLGSLKQKIPDKLRKKKNEKLQACMHKTIIDKKILYKQLKNANKLPNSEIITTTIGQNQETITTLNKLKNYDDWKLSFVTKDAAMKVGAATTGFIPIIPVDELVRTGAYVIEEKYRMRNKANMKHRITSSLNALKEWQHAFTTEDYQAISNCLTNVQEMKTRHIELKENKVRRMQAIHLTAAVATPVTDIAGPIGTGSRNAAKGAAKVANSVYPMVQRYKGDKKQKQRQSFNTSSDVYKLYKELYIKAKETNDLALKNAILLLADESFDLEPYEFETLINTSIVENKKFKLSFSRPIGYQARAPYYMHDTKL